MGARRGALPLPVKLRQDRLEWRALLLQSTRVPGHGDRAIAADALQAGVACAAELLAPALTLRQARHLI